MFDPSFIAESQGKALIAIAFMAAIFIASIWPKKPDSSWWDNFEDW